MWNRATDARRPPVSPSQQPAQEQPDLSALVERLAEVQAQLAATRPAYEYTGLQTLGGATSDAGPVASIMNPFATPCEIAIISWTSLADGSSTAMALTTQSRLDALTYVSVGTSATLSGQAQYLALAMVNGTEAPALTWSPLSASETLYLFAAATGASGNGAYVTIQFRRRINPAGVPNLGYP